MSTYICLPSCKTVNALSADFAKNTNHETVTAECCDEMQIYRTFKSNDVTSFIVYFYVRLDRLRWRTAAVAREGNRAAKIETCARLVISSTICDFVLCSSVTLSLFPVFFCDGTWEVEVRRRKRVRNVGSVGRIVRFLLKL